MTESEMEWFGDNIAARWQSTDLLAVARAFDLCKPYDSDIVLLAMDKLKQSTGDKLVVDADRLAAVCKQISEGGSEADAKTRAERAKRDALEKQNRTRAEREAAQTRLREIDEAEILPSSWKSAEAKCEREYQNIWKRMKPAARERLIRMAALGVA